MSAALEPAWDWDEIRVRCLKEARCMTASAADAEDVVQDALVRAWRMRAQCQDRGRPTSWVVQITRNEALRHHSRRTDQPLDPQGPWPEPGAGATPTDALLERLALDGALRSLPPEERMLLHLRYRRDLTQPALATWFGVPEGTVKVRLHRARARLRRAWIGS